MKLLLVGDPHVVPDELDDAGRLLDFVEEVADKTEPDFVVFLGDQYHTHAVVRLEVLDFWKRRLQTESYRSLMLVGNHDRPNDQNLKIHGLPETSSNHVVFEAEDIGGVRFLPWYHSNDEFTSKAAGAEIVVCHQTFNGSKYENGMWAPGGVEPDAVPAKMVIGGHLHSPQEFGHVWYPGAPRWRTMSDVNIDRNIWLFDTKTFERQGFSTRGHCNALYEFFDVEGGCVVHPEVIQPASVFVRIRGTESYVSARKGYWENLGYSVSTSIPRLVQESVKESNGLTQALSEYLEAAKLPHNTPRQVIKGMVAERIKL